MSGIGTTGTLHQYWNVDGLGWAKVHSATMDSAAILHWSGKSKGVCVKCGVPSAMHCVPLANSAQIPT